MSKHKENRTKIVFYSDSPVFGGHETVTVAIINELNKRDKYDLHLLYRNEKLLESLAAGVSAHRLPFATNLPLPFLRNFNLGDISFLKRKLKELNPDFLIVSQGDMEFGTKGLIAGKMVGVATISYIPMAYSFREMRAKFSLCRDVLSNFFYRLPSAFITINEFQKELIWRHSKKPVYVIHSPVDVENTSKDYRKQEKIFDLKCIHIAVVGRIVFKQKNQDILPKIAQEFAAIKQNVRIHVLGEGPDLNKLKRLVEKKRVSEVFVFHGWLNKKDLREFIMTKVDIVLIPSHFEGVPLVLLEAVSLGKKFLINDFLWLDEYQIPSLFRIDVNKPELIVNKILNLAKADCSFLLNDIKRNMMKKHAKRNFSESVVLVFSSLENNFIGHVQKC